ncbi:MAG: helix-turn-helix domain-containing protein [bacterium]
MTAVSNKAMEAFEAYDYLGNVRELSNLIERAIVLNQKPVLMLDCLPEILCQKDRKETIDIAIAEFNFAKAKNELIDIFEKKFLSKLLERYDGNVATAAEHAGIKRQSFYRLLKKHAIHPGQFSRLKKE